MNLENVNYDAFISYRHCELDKFVAENLHKQLEAFKVPKSLIASGKTNSKTKIERVFRDRDELPLASNLADPITTALSSSDYLIVICSPRLPESKWCLKEIETFIEMHGRDHILAVLIEGEPVDSFPDILRYEERIITDPDGSTHTEKVEVEPLAADVRGKDKKEVLKQIKNELLRLIAPILDCNYDDLKMRHKEAKQKKILRISLAISFVCLIFTAISTTMALTIHNQSNTIKEQYTKSLETQAVSYAATSQTLLSREDRMAAMAIARSVLPDTLSDQADKPYTPEAEYALSDSLGIYNNGRSSFAIRTLEQTSPITNMLISPETDTITTVDVNNQITIYDPSSGNTIVSFSVSGKYYQDLDDKEISYLNNEQLIYIVDGGYCIYDIPTLQETFFPLENTPSYLQCSGNGKYIALSGYDEVLLYDTEGTQLFSYECPDGFRGDEAMAFYSQKNVFAFTCTNISTDIPEGLCGLVDLNTMKVIYTKNVDIGYFAQASFLEDQVLFAGNSSYRMSDNLLDIKTKSFIYSYPLADGEENWIYEKEENRIEFFTGSLEWEAPVIVYAGSNGIEFINTEDGSVYCSYNTGADVVNIAPMRTDGFVYLLTEDGEKIMSSYDPLMGSMLIEEYDTSNGAFEKYEFTQSYDVGFRKNATAATIYNRMTSDRTENPASFEDYITDAVYSKQQQAMVLMDMDEKVYLYHTADNTYDSIVQKDNPVSAIFFTGEQDKQFALLSDGILEFYDTDTGELTDSVSLDSRFAEANIMSLDFLAANEDGSKLYFLNTYSAIIFIYDVAGESVTPIPLNTEEYLSTKNFGWNEDFSKYAIASTTDNTLTVYGLESRSELAKTQINASLVKNIIISEHAGCIFVTFLDQTVTAYSLEDLSTLHTYTEFATQVNHLDIIEVNPTEGDSPVPVYALYGNLDCYLLNEDLELVAHLYNYECFNSTKQTFYLACQSDLLEVPYYDYTALIEEADKQLEGYSLSDYQKNQLGIQ